MNIQLTRRLALSATLSLTVIASSVSLSAAVNRADRIDESVAQTLHEAKSRVDVRVPIDGVVQTLELEPFRVYAPDAVIHVMTPRGDQRTSPPAVATFRGHIAGERDSLVYLSEHDGVLEGVVSRDGNNYILAREQDQNGHAQHRFYRSSEFKDEEQYSCATEALSIPEAAKVARQISASAIVASAVAPKSKNYSVRVAVETDNELRAKFASANALATYITNVIGAASTIYQRDVNTYLLVGDVFTYEGVSDPWAVVPPNTTTAALYELGNYWHANRASVVRGAVAMLSGKNFGGGVGWIGSLGTLPANEFFCGANVCTSDGLTGYSGAYSVNGSLTGVVNTTTKTSSTFWDVLEVAHELGHNFNSLHTHCIASSGYGRTFVDYCVQSSAGSGCYSGSPALPQELGTIMSYCHLFNNGLAYQNTRLIFGQAGEASEAVLPPMTTEVVNDAPAGGISASSASVCAASTGNTLSYTGAPGGATFSWSITNGTITGGASSSTVTYTAGNSGKVALFVTVTGTNGISTNTGADIDITAAGLSPSSANVVAAGGSGSFNVTATCSWKAVSNDAFITITSPVGGNGSGNGSVGYTVAANAGAQRVGTISVSGQTYTITQAGVIASATRGDMTGDGKPDIVWRNRTTGQNAIWVMNGTAVTNTIDLPGLVNSNYYIQGTADMNNDGVTDIIWRNQSTGANAIWLLNASGLVASTVDLPALPNTSYSIQATGDFNNDGKADIVWRNQSTGANAVWLMNGTLYSSTVDLPSLPNSSYRIGGAGDFNNDQKPDILWRNYSNGANAIWLMNGTSFSSTVDLPAIPNVAYVMSGAADYNANGTPDIIWRNSSNGANALWLMSGTSYSSTTDLPAMPNTAYELVGPR